ncbi:hypothetical protein HMPREF3198_00015 [Winkia neuii]|nr:hypothetical protein HMPREF3198_00015 [Winkia neuii]
MAELDHLRQHYPDQVRGSADHPHSQQKLPCRPVDYIPTREKHEKEGRAVCRGYLAGRTTSNPPRARQNAETEKFQLNFVG